MKDVARLAEFIIVDYVTLKRSSRFFDPMRLACSLIATTGERLRRAKKYPPTPAISNRKRNHDAKRASSVSQKFDLLVKQRLQNDQGGALFIERKRRT